MKSIWISLALLSAVVPALNAAAPDYLREIKPLLAEHCYRCHGASQQKGGLRLDTVIAARKGGEHGPAIGAPVGAESLLLRVVRGTHDGLARMPYKKPPLSEEQIARLSAWIEHGAPAPANEEPDKHRHWAFVPPVRPPVPEDAQADGRRSRTGARAPGRGATMTPPNPIDAFIRERLAREKIAPAPEADRVTLIRRLSLDLVGLPPSLEEVDAFVNDRAPDAYGKLVERLLASPHYGERWGRWWLDAARYADSNGYSIDAPRSIWKFRDWVIEALNRDLPFDQFTIEQLAGDLLPGATLEQKIATGFHRNTQVNQEGGIDPEQFRVESVMDRVNTTATVWLGVTLACAQCHDHKFDPFTQRDYYRFYAFFNSTIDDGHGKDAPEGTLEIPGEMESDDQRQKEFEEAEFNLDRYLSTKTAEMLKWEESLSPEGIEKLKPAVRAALKIPFADRTKQQRRTVYAAFNPDDRDFKERAARLAKLERARPRPVTTLVMVEQAQPRETRIFTKGDFTRPADLVSPGVPAVFQSAPANATSNRLDLARWLMDTNNPLTARVIVNRVWQHYFGRGLVETENDFGTQGTPPTHPELLDWLACEFMAPSVNAAGGPSRNIRPAAAWSLKHLHRLIVHSATYRQSSRSRPELALLDPNNKLLARQSRLRLDAEIVRDVGLAASGLLHPKIGGPGVFPPQPEGVMNLGQLRREWKPSTGPDRYRRGMYTFFWRATPNPALMVFDSADGFSACTRRIRSNTPLQALTLLNDEAFHEFAAALATRMLDAGPMKDSERIELGFRWCLARKPDSAERARLLKLLRGERTAGDDRAAWTSVARVLLNLDETITRE